jgi:hypothetical protein
MARSSISDALRPLAARLPKVVREHDVTWQGQRYTVDWHINNGGNTRSPKRCLRIYYFWDAATQQFVVADMPAHRRTTAT